MQKNQSLCKRTVLIVLPPGKNKVWQPCGFKADSQESTINKMYIASMPKL